MYGIIYETTNLVNGKKYIGQHKCANEHDSYLGSGFLIKEAVEKYGSQNFIRKTLCVCDSAEELNEKEKYYIKLYNAVEDDSYYNLVEGGEWFPVLYGKDNGMYGRSGILSPVYGRKHTDEELKKISETQKGKTVVVTEETKNKISATMKEKVIKPTRQAYEKLKGKKGSINAGRKHRHVLCVETGVVYESQSEVEIQLGIPQSNLTKVLNGYRHTAGGYHFKYTEDEVMAA